MLAALDEGRLRVAEQIASLRDPRLGEAVDPALFCSTRDRGFEVGPFHYATRSREARPCRGKIRVVPPTIRYGAHLEPGVVVMPSYINVGAWVGAGTMVDTWATVGSCAQVGRSVHISGGVGIGGVLEPVQARPVVIGDYVFLGSRCVVVEGVHVDEAAVLGSGVILTASTPIVDVRGVAPVVTKGRIPPRAVVIPGTMPKQFPAGEFQVPCALIIGERSATTDRKTSLNEVLREFHYWPERIPRRCSIAMHSP